MCSAISSSTPLYDISSTLSIFFLSSMIYRRYLTNKATTSYLSSNSNKFEEKIQKRNESLPSFSELVSLRKNHFSKNQSLSYSNTNPLYITKGVKSRLISADGISYLDTRNNVPLVGHSHAHIAEAIYHQALELNTNTRYITCPTIKLAQELTKTLPKPLEVVFLVNSGSEANDLAYRIAHCCSQAKSATDSSKIICVESGYHGHTMATLELSHYKFSKSQEWKLKSSVHENIISVPAPNLYRISKEASYKQERSDVAHYYANYVKQACVSNYNITAMIIESGMSVGGVLIPPKNYLNLVKQYVNDAGGLLVVDEVQTGFGRLGECFWAFQLEDKFIPDIVTIGKPFGNGMPLAALVTTREIADTFAQRCNVEYFNTFGGNTVCAAAGLATLEVIKEEKLQENASIVGNYLVEKLNLLQQKHELIGDVRGLGLFLGIEFITDSNTLAPATKETSYLCAMLKDKHYILTTIDGPFDNVLVVKPPLCFSTQDADEFLHGLDCVLTDLQGVSKFELDSFSITPT